MAAQPHQIQLRRKSRGPGTRSNASSGVRPQVSVLRPISIWAATFTPQPSRISQSRVKPAVAPTAVVAISSPEPTMELARMIPGPRWTSLPANDRGGSCGVGAASEDSTMRHTVHPVLALRRLNFACRLCNHPRLLGSENDPNHEARLSMNIDLAHDEGDGDAFAPPPPSRRRRRLRVTPIKARSASDGTPDRWAIPALIAR